MRKSANETRMRLRPDISTHQLISHLDPPSDGGSERRAQRAHVRKRTQPEDQTGIQDDVNGVGDPRETHPAKRYPVTAKIEWDSGATLQ